MGFIFHFKNNRHCTLTAAIEFFCFAAIGVSIYVMIFLNASFGQNLLVLFVISAISAGVGLVLYHAVKHKN